MSEHGNSSVPFNQSIACENCGRFGAYAFDGKSLCVDCYELHGSCCPEFTRDEATANAKGPAATE